MLSGKIEDCLETDVAVQMTMEFDQREGGIDQASLQSAEGGTVLCAVFFHDAFDHPGIFI